MMLQKNFTVIDLTPKCQGVLRDLRCNYHMSVFNPALLYIPQWNGYLFSFRYIGRTQDKDHIKINKKAIKSPYDERHPWKSQWKTCMLDGTTFGFISETTPEETTRVNIHQDGQQTSHLLQGVQDARLFLNGNNVIMICNMVVGSLDSLFTGDWRLFEDDPYFAKYHRQIQKFDQGCTPKAPCQIMVAHIFQLGNVGGSLKLVKSHIMCPNLSMSKEKNWSIWSINNDNLYISYNISGSHQVFKAHENLNNSFEVCNIISVVPSPITKLLMEIEDYTGNNVFISLSTPALPFVGGELLAVGHIKFKYEKIGQLASDNPRNILLRNLKAFDDSLGKGAKKRHYEFTYAMFFYTFEPLSFEIVRMSGFFVPVSADGYEHLEHNVFFPSNLTVDNHGFYYVSYGVSDIMCKLAIFGHDVINDMLSFNVKTDPLCTLITPMPKPKQTPKPKLYGGRDSTMPMPMPVPMSKHIGEMFKSRSKNNKINLSVTTKSERKFDDRMPIKIKIKSRNMSLSNLEKVFTAKTWKSKSVSIQDLDTGFSVADFVNAEPVKEFQSYNIDDNDVVQFETIKKEKKRKADATLRKAFGANLSN
jgi:hypothetical protein